MKTLSVAMILLAGLQAFAASTTLNCKMELAGKKYDYLKITYTANKTVTDLTIQNYEFIKNGTRLKDSQIGQSVFGVVISPLTQNDDGTLQIEAGLHDYSAVASWKFMLSEGGLEAAVITTYQSSDGDDQLHVSTQALKCE